MAEAAVGNAPQSGLSSPSGVGLLFRNGFCLSGKANLHPLAFYTINVTSPWGFVGRENRKAVAPHPSKPAKGVVATVLRAEPELANPASRANSQGVGQPASGR